MEKAKYQQGEWTILTITDNGITIPARYKTKDWETGWNEMKHHLLKKLQKKNIKLLLLKSENYYPIYKLRRKEI